MTNEDAAHRSAEDPFPPLVPDTGCALEDRGLLSRAQGCLLGQIAGDALGSLVEFSSAAQIEARYPGGPRTLEDGGCWDTLAGQPTDDSELALVLARTLVDRGRYDEEAVARAYHYWYDSHPFDCGQATRAAFGPARDPSPETQANGALMRISPLAILGHRLPPERLASWARADSRLSHPHPVCQDANAVFTVSLAYAIRTGADPEQVYSFALDWAAGADLHPDVRAELDGAKAGPPDDYMGRMGWVRTALRNAYHQLLWAPTLEEAVCLSVAAGGDTDTNAAIAGALAGAVHGAAAVPGQWLASILTCRPLPGAPGVRRPRPWPFWPVDALQVAERLVACGREIAAESP